MRSLFYLATAAIVASAANGWVATGHGRSRHNPPKAKSPKPCSWSRDSTEGPVPRPWKGRSRKRRASSPSRWTSKAKPRLPSLTKA